MKTVTIKPLNDKVPVRTQTNILDSLLANKCDVAMACGGQGICATCHVYIREGSASLSPVNDRERRTLGLVTGARQDSRLACQCQVIGEGVVVELPEGMYLSAVNDLQSLIGRRTETNIMHPRDGRILIAKGNIITKSRILELESEDFNILNARAATAQS